MTQHVNEDAHRNDVITIAGVFGCPKSSTQAHSRELKEYLRLAVAWAAFENHIVKKIAKENNKSTVRTTQKNHCTWKEKYGLLDDVKISHFLTM